MDNLVESLKKQGWYLSKEKLENEFQEDDVDNLKKLFLRDPEKWLIHQDLKELGLQILPDEVNSGRITQLQGPIVLQIKKITNISAPQANVGSNTAPRILKLTLTDGKITCYGIEYQNISNISLNTPPGTKVRLINSVSISHGFILLNSRNLHILGGEVPHLVQSWKVQQSLIGHVRGGNQHGGPPPWVPFGEKISASNVNITKLDDDKDSKEKEPDLRDEEFQSQRQEAIAAASHTGSKKVFGGTAKQMDIRQPERRGRGRGARRGQERTYDDESAPSSKPRDSIRLFEFLQPKIGAEDEETLPEPEPTYNQSFRGNGRRRSHQRRAGSSRARGSRESYQRTPNFTTTREVDKLVNDFASWPGLGDQATAVRKEPTKGHNWTVNSYCLAKWESSNQEYPAVIQNLSMDGRTARVTFIETGAIREVEIKNLRQDPQDGRNISHHSNQSNYRGQGMRVFTRRNRARY